MADLLVRLKSKLPLYCVVHKAFDAPEAVFVFLCCFHILFLMARRPPPNHICAEDQPEQPVTDGPPVAMLSGCYVVCAVVEVLGGSEQEVYASTSVPEVYFPEVQPDGLPGSTPQAGGGGQ